MFSHHSEKQRKKNDNVYLSSLKNDDSIIRVLPQIMEKKIFLCLERHVIICVPLGKGMVGGIQWEGKRRI